jgi:predicted CoA-binding protein
LNRGRVRQKKHAGSALGARGESSLQEDEMTTKAAVAEFMGLKVIAVAGASRDTKKFGYAVYRELKDKGHTVYPVNPNAESIDGDPCFHTLAGLPSVPDGLVIVTASAQTEQLVREAAQAGIRHIWLQQGAESAAALKACQDNGISVVSGECIFMYAEPSAWFHSAHRWVNGVIGKGLK